MAPPAYNQQSRRSPRDAINVTGQRDSTTRGRLPGKQDGGARHREGQEEAIGAEQSPSVISISMPKSNLPEIIASSMNIRNERIAATADRATNSAKNGGGGNQKRCTRQQPSPGRTTATCSPLSESTKAPPRISSHRDSYKAVSPVCNTPVPYYSATSLLGGSRSFGSGRGSPLDRDGDGDDYDCYYGRGTPSGYDFWDHQFEMGRDRRTERYITEPTRNDFLLGDANVSRRMMATASGAHGVWSPMQMVLEPVLYRPCSMLSLRGGAEMTSRHGSAYDMTSWYGAPYDVTSRHGFYPPLYGASSHVSVPRYSLSRSSYRPCTPPYATPLYATPPYVAPSYPLLRCRTVGEESAPLSLEARCLPDKNGQRRCYPRNASNATQTPCKSGMDNWNRFDEVDISDLYNSDSWTCFEPPLAQQTTSDRLFSLCEIVAYCLLTIIVIYFIWAIAWGVAAIDGSQVVDLESFPGCCLSLGITTLLGLVSLLLLSYAYSRSS